MYMASSHPQGALTGRLIVSDSHQTDRGDHKPEVRRGKLISWISTHAGFRISDAICSKSNPSFHVQNVVRCEKYLSLNNKSDK